MKEQLSQLLQELNLTATQFADKIGVQRSSISHILSGRNQPSYDFILKVLNQFPEIDAEWLLTGNGGMLKDKKLINDVEPSIKAHGTLQLFDQKEPGIKNEAKEQRKNVKINPAETTEGDVTNVNNAKTIIVLYGDKTFEEFRERPSHT